MRIKLTQPPNGAVSTPSVTLGQSSDESTFPEVLTQREAARYLRISVDTLKKLTDENIVPARRIGSRIIYGRDALKKWVNEF